MNRLLLVFVLSIVSFMAGARPLWLRYPQVSPDGKQIVFTYKGDIYKVPVEGGVAQRLTTHPGYESFPIWSPDGKQIAFTSDRNGNFDLFVMPAEGGEAKRLTTFSGREVPYTFTPDGKEVVYSAQIQAPASSIAFRSMPELYAVSVNGERPRQVLGTPAEWISYVDDGKQFLYQDRKGVESEWRKHHTSSVTRDIYLYDVKSGKHTCLMNWKGEDRNPVFSKKEGQVYFLSERNGSFNVYAFSLQQPEHVKAVTSFKTHPVRFLSVADDGLLCFTYDGEIYTKMGSEKPKRLDIQIIGDDNARNISYQAYTTGLTDATISPDGKQVALIQRGNVFVTSADYVTTKQISSTPEQEKWLSFAPDGRQVVYASERGGNWNIYVAKIARPEEINFPNATIIEEKALFPTSSKERFAPQFSPDGKEVAFVEDRTKLMVLNLETKKVRQITDGKYHYRTDDNFIYSWSPDGKWFTLEIIGNGRDPYSDVAIVSASGKGEVVNITNSGYFNSNPRWVLDGNAILYASERYGMRNHASWGSMRDVMIVFLNQAAYDRFRLNKENLELLKEEEKVALKTEKERAQGKNTGTKEITVELKNIGDRIMRLTPNSSSLGDAVLSKDGEKLYYMAAFEGGLDLWEMSLRDRSTKVLHKLNSGWASLGLDRDGKTLFLLNGRGMQKIPLASGKRIPITYRAEMELDHAAERAYMFDRVRRQQQKRFYRTDMHGVDWPMMTKAYEKFLPHINNNYDFAELLSELLGELNVSHTGSGYRPNLGGDNTAELGLFFDWDYKKDGLLIEEVLEKGPFDQERSKVKAGHIIEQIDGQKIKAGMDYFPLLNKKVGKKICVGLYDPRTKTRWEEVVTPVSRSALMNLLYSRWVKKRAAEVDSLSNGRLGYVHLVGMSDWNYRVIYSDILGKYNDREGIVIDTRFNGGGRLHEDIEVLFSGEKYFTQVIRGREACDMPSRRWNKPSIMLMGEANYSNAHGTPWVYKFKKIGTLVGMPVPGTMTSVNWETLQDPTLFFGIPIVGYRLPDGSYLENTQLEPDVKIANTPERAVQGYDDQLKKAVDVLLQEIDARK